MKAAVGSLLFFVVAPGTVAGLIPWWLTDNWSGFNSDPWRVGGTILIALGICALIVTFTRFVVEGKGTPAPIAPTKRLVVGGLNSFVRNPMYVAIIAIVLGEAMIFESAALLWYAGLTWLVPAAFVRFYEEPTLRRTFGAEYEEYCANVPAWIPRLTPWQQPRR